MSSLAKLPELVGFFSYSRKDDEYSQGALSKLRVGIYNELRLQLGRDFRLWQDTAAIPQGALWEDEIVRAISEAAFFIPIVTPSAVGSGHCRFEFESFLRREATLGRKDLVFPILYIRVPALDKEALWREDELLECIGSRQYVDWQKFRHRDLASTEVAEKIELFCNSILEALHLPWNELPQGRHEEEAEIQHRAAQERRREEAEAERRAEEERREAAALAQQRAEEDRRRQEAETERRAEEERRKAEALAQQRAEEDRRKAEALARERAAQKRRLQEAEAQHRANEQAQRVSAETIPAFLSGAPPAPERVRTLRPGSGFKDAAICPEMVIVPAGEFAMGSHTSAPNGPQDEMPPRAVVFSRPFAVSRFAVTFDEWDAAAANGGCNGYRPADQGWGRGQRPVINVSWNDAKAYAEWLATMTGKPYRLLAEAEYEYAARAGTQTAYPWGDTIGKQNVNCNGGGSKWDNKQTAPSGSFTPNQFGLFDMVGNVWAWVEDCWHNNYQGAPQNGAAWIEGGNCSYRVVRGGSWSSVPQMLRSARRNRFAADRRDANLGFRVARALDY